MESVRPAAFEEMHRFVVDLYSAALDQDTDAMSAATKGEALAAYFEGPIRMVPYPDLDPQVTQRLQRLAEESGCGGAPFGVGQ